MKFFTRSLLILVALYGLLFAIGDLYLARVGIPIWGALAFAVIFVGTQYLIGPWIIEYVLDITWDDHSTQIPDRNRKFIEQLCAERGLTMPRIGIIQSGTPNAFSFGRVPADSRVVVTTGLLEVLTIEEANAVLAHEIGHIEHWDFVVMTVASLVPLLLYQLYTYSRHINNFRSVAYGAYACYWVSQFVVLFLNRTREFFADHYAAEVTHTPDVLASALVKIAYGMVKANGDYQQAQQKDSGMDKGYARSQQRLAGSIAVMGISNFRSGSALALSGADPVAAAAVMRWDLVNPWARVYEFNSTHPLTALRVRELNLQTEANHRLPQYPLPQERTMQWGNFAFEVVLWAVPALGIAAMFVIKFIPEWLTDFRVELPTDIMPMLLIFTGCTWILRTLYRYRGDFQPATIGSLLEDVEVSEMRPRAVRLQGEIVGRGVPGAFWSPDLVLRDSTGIIFMLYRQSIPFARFLFAVTNADDFLGEQVEIEGWFRRGLRPYVEMSRLSAQSGRLVSRAYSRWVQLILAAGAVLVGCWWLLS